MALLYEKEQNEDADEIISQLCRELETLGTLERNLQQTNTCLVFYLIYPTILVSQVLFRT